MMGNESYKDKADKHLCKLCFTSSSAVSDIGQVIGTETINHLRN